jgi:hypothetical protein
VSYLLVFIVVCFILFVVLYCVWSKVRFSPPDFREEQLQLLPQKSLLPAWSVLRRWMLLIEK